MLEKGLLATLSDGKDYIVLSVLEINGIKYVYLTENDNLGNVMFCTQENEQDNVKLTEVTDMNLRRTLLEKFTKKLKEEYEGL